MIRRLFTWWKRQGCIAKLAVGFLLFVFVSCVCSIPIAILSPETTPTPQEAAQESSAPTPTIHTPLSQSPTAEPTVPTELSPAPSATPITEFHLTLPQEVRNNEGWVFTIYRVEPLQSIDAASRRYTPESGVFLVLIGTVTNFTDRNDCIQGQDFTLRNSSEIYNMSSDIVGAAKEIYALDYPGFFMGQCLDYDETEDSYLVFDVPTDANDLWLRLDEAEIRLGQMSSLMQATPIAIVTPRPTNTPPPPTPVDTPAPTNTPLSEGIPGVIQSLSEFEESQFCLTYHCRFDDSWSLRSGGTNNAYDIDVIPVVSVEVTTLRGAPTDFGLMFFDRGKLTSDDLQLVFSFLSSIYPGVEVDLAIKSFIEKNVEIDVFQICQAESIPFGSMRIWAGKVLEQTVSIGENCPQ